MAFGYPVMLEVRGRRCVVVGGGAVGESKVRGLLSAGAEVTVIDPKPTGTLEDLAELGGVTLVRRAYRKGDLAGAFVAIAATDDGATNSEIFAEAQQERVLLNAVDDSQYCHFAVPSIVRRGDLLLTLSTGGKAPALAKRLRKGLASQFGEEYATLVDLLAEVREAALAVRDVDFDEWAARWEAALEDDLIGLVRAGRYGEVKDHVWRHLNAEREPAAGHVWIVGAGPGDPGLITVDGRRALDRADVVVYDRLVDPSLVEGKEAVYAGKTPGKHGPSQTDINQTLVRLAGEGRRVVRLKGGDPFVFGRGAEEAEALAEAGIGFTVIPAPTSAIAAAAAAGIPVTDRRFSSSVAIVTGHCGGPREVDWRALAGAVETIVVLMGLANAEPIAAELMAGGLSPSTPVAAIENGTRPDQRVVVTDLQNLPQAAAAAGLGSPSLLVIGQVVTLREKLAPSAEVKA
ncbi:MAG TPA: siroheme synthase CysG, partial [Actinomycetota bacterium]|nr:siroheme synthase CysG [Actinomycetota bacterium]